MDLKTNKFSDKLIFPKKPNDEYVKEYCFSKAAKKYLDMGKCNAGDDLDWNVNLVNYTVKQQLENTNKTLNDTRELCKKQRKLLNDQWNDLEAKEIQLQKQFIEFNKFIIENTEKRNRAADKIVEQNSLKINWEKSIKELKTKIDEISKVKILMDQNISKYKIYEQYLNTVVENDQSMHSIDDIIKRYRTLTETRNQLHETQQTTFSKLEKAEMKLKQLIENYSQQIISMKNKLNQLEEKYNAAILNCRKWQKIYQYVKQEAADNLISTITIKECCNQIYTEICQRNGKKPLQLESIEKQLLVIKRAISEYEIVNRKINEQKELDLIASNQPKANLIESKNQIMLTLNNRIVDLQARYENASIKALNSERLVTQIKMNAVKQLSEINMVKQSIWNLYVHIVTSKNRRIRIKKENVEEQLMFINQIVTGMTKVNEMIKQKEK